MHGCSAPIPPSKTGAHWSSVQQHAQSKGHHAQHAIMPPRMLVPTQFDGLHAIESQEQGCTAMPPVPGGRVRQQTEPGGCRARMQPWRPRTAHRPGCGTFCRPLAAGWPHTCTVAVLRRTKSILISCQNPRYQPPSRGLAIYLRFGRHFEALQGWAARPCSQTTAAFLGAGGQ